ncbi:urease, beta subunit [Campylobacter blaseri]|uniref:Urease subunit beta n=1 Tax=Campylobacter blaseri TaxID=2042961 RepID=A0A2P8QYZ3_9BACT|nr:urease subunit beta [Campylobacter blaseri]PSM51457.1 urease subunit beta [Campylobacter blaseri]PSM52906.1 urease subunit beta [Campylobacter blaseri]QKF86539.1 urease, beta subunit [Campylobacter blaseri]
MIPGEVFYKDEDITLNEGKETRELIVTNKGDRAIQIGSHFHFFEINKNLEFDRRKAFGFRLDIPAGNAIRFEPGQSHKVSLVELGGNSRVIGFNGLTNGVTLNKRLDEVMDDIVKLGFANKESKEE